MFKTSLVIKKLEASVVSVADEPITLEQLQEDWAKVICIELNRKTNIRLAFKIILNIINSFCTPLRENNKINIRKFVLVFE